MTAYKMDKPHFVEKGWGKLMLSDADEGERRIGEIWAYQNDKEQVRKVETVKVLYFGQGKRLSLHFHGKKEEIFVCADGLIEIEIITPEGEVIRDTMATGDRYFIPKFTPHRMTGLALNNILVEVSTLHEDSDSYRIERGD